MKARICCLALLLCIGPALFAVDFGATLNLTDDIYQDTAENKTNTLKFSANPWLSLGLSEKVQVYASGSVWLKHLASLDDNKVDGKLVDPKSLFELTRTQVTIRPIPGVSVEAGRIPFGDTHRFAASGLYDGILGGIDLGIGRLGLGFFYTGLLYKETAEILMNDDDYKDYAAQWDWKEFGVSYFASRRLLGGLRWDMPIVRAVQDSLTFDFLFQVDVNDRKEEDNYVGKKINTQYIELAYLIQPMQLFGVQVGGIFELIQDEAADKDLQVAFGGLAEAFVDLPLAFPNRLTLGARGFSGQMEDEKTLAPFTPVKGQAMGQVFEDYKSLMALSLLYEARVINSLALSAAFRYFLLTDDTAYSNYNGTDKNAKALGGEIYGSLNWSPLDDLAVSLGGGVFLPKMGNVYKSDDKPSWKVSMGLTLSF